MESTRFDNSTKDIPLPSENYYKCKLTEKTEHLCKSIRWKAFFYFKPSADGSRKETFGFSSRKSPPHVLAMLNFETKLLNMIETIKFRKVKCEKLSSDIYNNIMKSDTLLVPTDKTSNFYKMDTASYNDLLQKNITKTYKKVTHGTTNSIELEAKVIAKKMHLDDRINITEKREAFITLKDHKPNFVKNLTCRLVNPAKTEIDRISKQLLDRINAQLANHLKLNQCKNTKAVLSWFTDIQHKDMYSFIAFDVVEFYPSISIELLSEALQFPSGCVTITDNERHIILQAKSSILYNYGEPWVKKASSNLFDVTMGSYDRAESCELVCTYPLHKIKEKFGSTCDFGLYRDDGVGISKAPPRRTELIKKNLFVIFRNCGLKITIEANQKTVNLLHVTLSLSDGKYMAYTRPGNTPLYVNKKSNHPPGIIDNIPKSITKRLSEISNDEYSFNEAAPLYQKALDDSGYNHHLAFTPSITQSSNSTRRNRHINIIWYSPPSKNVATNVERTLLKILDEEFPESHVLHKIFNRNTVKVSYCCMPKLKQKIDGNNKSTLQKTTTPPVLKACNCRIPADCTMAGNCLTPCVVFQAIVTIEDNRPAQTYVGLPENSFKARFPNHKSSFNNPNKRLSTELSKHAWCLKEASLKFHIIWKILKQTSPYNPVSKRCNLYLWEKYLIICRPEIATLNKRNELVTSCRHAKKFILKNFKPTIAASKQVLELRALTTVQIQIPRAQGRLSASVVTSHDRAPVAQLASRCHAGGREFNSGRTNTQGL